MEISEESNLDRSRWNILKLYSVPTIEACKKKMAKLRSSGVELPVIRPIGHMESIVELAANSSGSIANIPGV